MERYDIINYLISKNNYKSFLEIGTQNKNNYKLININEKSCVDPDLNSNADYIMTSDEYFKNNFQKYDIIFIDGLHHADYVYRDIINSLNILNKNGSIIVHDVIPFSYESQIIPLKKAYNNGAEAWNGDVWKAWIKLRIERDDLSMKCVNVDHGCGIIQLVERGEGDYLLDFQNGYYNYNKDIILNNLNLINENEFIDLYADNDNLISENIHIENMNKRVYITHVTIEYLDVAINLAKSVRLFSDIPLIVYCINMLDNDKQKFNEILNVYTRDINIDLTDSLKDDYEINNLGNFYINRQSDRIYKILCAKTIAMEMALSEGFEEVCYLDSDCIATSLIDDLFEWMPIIDDYPIATKGIYEYLIIIDNNIEVGNPFINLCENADNKLCLEWPLMNFLEIDENNRGIYRTTGIMLMNKKCLPFIKIWKEFCYILPKLVNVKKYAPFHEETIYNVLSWKKTNVGFPLCYVNIGDGLNTVKNIYLDDNENNQNWDNIDNSKKFYKIPEDKRDIKVLHGEKRTSEVNLILEYLKKMK
jgi:hypothetical protein